MSIEWIIIFLILGTFVGFMAGLLGVGGGGIMVPALTTIFLAQKVPVEHAVHLALGTSMASIVLTSISSLITHHKHRAVLWDIFIKMSPFIILGTFLITFIVSKLNSLFLSVFFACFMGYVSFNTLFGKSSNSGKNSTSLELFFVSFGIGSVSAMVSIGGGSLTVPYLTWRNVELKKAIGTSAAIGLPISFAGTIGYLLQNKIDLNLDYVIGNINLLAVLIISLASITTATLGAKLAHKLPVKVLKKVFGIMLFLLSFNMFWTVFNHS